MFFDELVKVAGIRRIPDMDLTKLEGVSRGLNTPKITDSTHVISECFYVKSITNSYTMTFT